MSSIRMTTDHGAGMRLGSLKAKYREEYAALRAEARGQGELP